MKSALSQQLPVVNTLRLFDKAIPEITKDWPEQWQNQPTIMTPEKLLPALLKNRLPVLLKNTLPVPTKAATDIPSANAPDPTAANPEVNPNAAGDKPSDAVSDVDESAQTKPPAKKAAAPKGDKPKAAGDKPASGKKRRKHRQLKTSRLRSLFNKTTCQLWRRHSRNRASKI